MGNISLTNAPWLSPRSRQENQENSEGLGLQPLRCRVPRTVEPNEDVSESHCPSPHFNWNDVHESHILIDTPISWLTS